MADGYQRYVVGERFDLPAEEIARQMSDFFGVVVKASDVAESEESVLRWTVEQERAARAHTPGALGAAAISPNISKSRRGDK